MRPGGLADKKCLVEYLDKYLSAFLAEHRAEHLAGYPTENLAL